MLSSQIDQVYYRKLLTKVISGWSKAAGECAVVRHKRDQLYLACKRVGDHES